MRRRLAYTLATLLVLLVVVVVTLPLWLGVAVRTFGESRGVRFGTYERIGYARFTLRDVVVEVKQANVRVTASRVEADTPVLWAWRHWRRVFTPIAVERWSVTVGTPPPSTTPPKAPSTERGWLPLQGLLHRIVNQLDKWLPNATIGPGVVRFPGGEIALDAAKWEKRALDVKGLAYRALKVDAVAAFPTSDSLRVDAHTTEKDLVLSAEGHGAEVGGKIVVWDQPVTLSATFGTKSWMPVQAALVAEQWRVPGAKLKLGEVYSAVHGSSRVEWRENEVHADVDIGSDPVAGKSAPPLKVIAHAHGDGQTFKVESFQIAIPGVTAQLNEPITIDRTGKIQESAARFAVAADLAKQPWFAAKGTVKGEARLLSSVAAMPVIDLSVEASGVSAQDIDLSAVQAQGRFEWPRLQIASGTLVGGEGERLTLKGEWDFKAKELAGVVVEGQIRRQSVARWLPPQPAFDVVKISAHAEGSTANVAHGGKIEASEVTVSGVKPLALSLEWHGSGPRVEQFDLHAQAGATSLAVGGAVDASALTLARVELTQNNAPRLKLAAPATVRWKPSFELESLRLTGGESDLNASLQLGETGHVEFSLRGLSSTWLGDLVSLPGPVWEVNSLALMGSWDKGPMKFSLTAAASLDIEEGRRAAVLVSAQGDKQGIKVEAVRATESNSTVINATGRIPITVTPAATPLIKIDPSGAVAVDATVAPNSAFWQKLAAVSGVDLQEPAASAHLTGTWQRPQGIALLKAARIAIDPKRVPRPLPAISNLDVKIVGQPDGVSLEKFAIEIEGQALRAEGRLPVPKGGWAELVKQPLATARTGADLRVEVPDAEVAVFARFLPAVLAPKGRLQADFRYRNGGVEGYLKLQDAASRPLGPLGVLQEISADIGLSGRKLALRGVTARSGGQPVTLSGTVEIPEGTAPQPRFDLTLKGENLPFVRQTGLLVRGDLDLRLQTPPGSAASSPPRLSGTVRLRDSLFLADVRSFLPKGGAGPTRRPPYFAVETPPVNVWPVSIDISGDRFMRLRTPVFSGVASAHFRLGGTLGEPRAIGEATIDEGRVRMPFAGFDVQQGAIRLTEADPYEPTIYLRATGRRYDYDLTMEIDGKATGPNVTFNSSPGLDSEQVLLMVMAGSAPKNEITRSSTERFAGVGYFLGQSLIGNLLGGSGDADRLTVETGEKVSRAGNETYEVEYKLSDRWTLTAERNEFDEYNGGVKWRVFGGRHPTEASGNAKK